MKHRISFVWVVLLAAAWLVPQTASANFHIMQIDQVIGGVGGDPNAQAIELSMRTLGQNVLANQARLVVRDAAGANPVTLIAFTGTNPANSAACRQILIATPGFLAKTTPGTVADYATMAPIPASYLAAGSLTFEGVIGSINYWRVSWGGAGYTGSQAIDPTNSATGVTTTAPPFAGPLPSTGTQALRFTPACATPSTSTAAQYALTAGAAVFTNNALGSFTVNAPASPIPGLPGVSKLLLPAVLGLAVLAIAFLRRRSA